MDNIGNQIKVGDLIYYRGEYIPIAEVIEVHDGGVSMRDGSKSPSTVTMIIKLTVAAPWRIPFKDMIAVRKPGEEGETKIASA
jgi:hypothetical protein